MHYLKLLRVRCHQWKKRLFVQRQLQVSDMGDQSMLAAKKMLLVLLCVTMFNHGAVAQNVMSDSTEQARRYVREIMKNHSLPGLSVAVAVDGKIAWYEGFGEADLENHLPVRPTTKFRLGSVSKTLTIAALGLVKR